MRRPFRHDRGPGFRPTWPEPRGNRPDPRKRRHHGGYPSPKRQRPNQYREPFRDGFHPFHDDHGHFPPDFRDFPPGHGDFPPDFRDFPPDYREFPPDHRDFPPEHRDFPPEHRDFPPDHRDFPPDHRHFPPDRVFPPEHRDFPPEHRDFPPERKESIWPESREDGFGEEFREEHFQDEFEGPDREFEGPQQSFDRTPPKKHARTPPEAHHPRKIQLDRPPRERDFHRGESFDQRFLDEREEQSYRSPPRFSRERWVKPPSGPPERNFRGKGRGREQFQRQEDFERGDENWKELAPALSPRKTPSRVQRKNNFRREDSLHFPPEHIGPNERFSPKLFNDIFEEQFDENQPLSYPSPADPNDVLVDQPDLFPDLLDGIPVIGEDIFEEPNQSPPKVTVMQRLIQPGSPKDKVFEISNSPLTVEDTASQTEAQTPETPAKAPANAVVIENKIIDPIELEKQVMEALALEKKKIRKRKREEEQRRELEEANKRKIRQHIPISKVIHWTERYFIFGGQKHSCVKLKLKVTGRYESEEQFLINVSERPPNEKHHLQINTEFRIRINDKTTQGAIWREMLVRKQSGLEFRVEKPSEKSWHMFRRLWERKKALDISNFCVDDQYHCWIVPLEVTKDVIVCQAVVLHKNLLSHICNEKYFQAAVKRKLRAIVSLEHCLLYFTAKSTVGCEHVLDFGAQHCVLRDGLTDLLPALKKNYSCTLITHFSSYLTNHILEYIKKHFNWAPDHMICTLCKGETLAPRDIHLCYTYKRRRNTTVILDEKRCWHQDFQRVVFDTSLKKERNLSEIGKCLSETHSSFFEKADRLQVTLPDRTFKEIVTQVDMNRILKKPG